MTNPYAKYLDGRPAEEIIAATCSRLYELVQPLDADKAEQAPSPGKWSVREIVSHLADCEVVFAFRIRQTLAEDAHVIQPFDQDRWAQKYGWYGARQALATFTAMRQWNLLLIGALDSADLDRKVHHPERGDMTLRTLVETMAGHDLNHLRQIEAIVRGTAASA